MIVQKDFSKEFMVKGLPILVMCKQDNGDFIL